MHSARVVKQGLAVDEARSSSAAFPQGSFGTTEGPVASPLPNRPTVLNDNNNSNNNNNISRNSSLKAVLKQPLP